MMENNFKNNICINNFSTTLDKGLRKNIKIRRDGETREHKLDEMGTLNMK